MEIRGKIYRGPVRRMDERTARLVKGVLTKYETCVSP